MPCIPLNDEPSWSHLLGHHFSCGTMDELEASFQALIAPYTFKVHSDSENNPIFIVGAPERNGEAQVLALFGGEHKAGDAKNMALRLAQQYRLGLQDGARLAEILAARKVVGQD